MLKLIAAILGLLIKLFLTIIIFLIVVTVLPGLPPHSTFSSIDLDPPLPLTGPLKKNNVLGKVERFMEGILQGPESIASRKHNEIFVSVAGGKIVRLSGKDFEHYSVVAVIGDNCGDSTKKGKCGRPLGIRFDKDGNLLVADSEYGILSVNVDTGEKKLIFNSSEYIDGRRSLLVDDLDIDKDGNIYWSDASYMFTLQEATAALFSDPTGRLIKYDPKTKRNTVLLPNVHFANGVQLSRNEDFLLVSESFALRVLRYWLKGPKKGTHDVFIAGLPGMPDNIRPSENGYYVSLVSVRNMELDWLTQMLTSCGFLRKMTMRIFYLIRYFAVAIDSIVPNAFCQLCSIKILDLGAINGLLSELRGFVVEMNENGEVISSLQSFYDSITDISETHRAGDYLFFGSPFNNYLGRLYVGEGLHVEHSEEVSKSEKVYKEEL